jgi:hypothetical protein
MSRNAAAVLDYFGDIAIALHRGTAPVTDLKTWHFPVAWVQSCAKYISTRVLAECGYGEIFGRLVIGLMPLLIGFRDFKGLQRGGPIHPHMEIGERFFNRFLDGYSICCQWRAQDKPFRFAGEGKPVAFLGVVHICKCSSTLAVDQFTGFRCERLDVLGVLCLSRFEHFAQLRNVLV